MQRRTGILAAWAVLGILSAGALVQAAVELPNLALKQTATASDSEDGNPPENAIDGDKETRWCNRDESTGAWWQVDLKEAKDLGGCEIMWEHDGAVYQCLVQGSVDGKTWKTLNDQRKSTQSSQVQKLALKGEPARYVRITVTGLDDGSWASFYEVKLIDAASMAKLTPEEAKAYLPSQGEKPAATAPATATAPAEHAH